MQQFNFITYIDDNGLLKIPDEYKLFNTKVRVYIEPIETQDYDVNNNKVKVEKVNSFLEKWTGFLKAADSDDAKFKYLSEKYK